jgi:hypothetical protein
VYAGKKIHFPSSQPCDMIIYVFIGRLAQALQLLGKALIQLVWNYWNAHYANEVSCD